MEEVRHNNCSRLATTHGHGVRAAFRGFESKNLCLELFQIPAQRSLSPFPAFHGHGLLLSIFWFLGSAWCGPIGRRSRLWPIAGCMTRNTLTVSSFPHLQARSFGSG